MVERYKFVGSGVTNSQGVAQLTHDANGNALATPGYVGSGKGLTQMCASLDSPTAISSGSDLSETYSIYDTLFYDKALSGTGNHNDNWTTLSNMTREETYTLFKGANAFYNSRVIINNSSDIPMGNYCVEFDVFDVNNAKFFVSDGTGKSVSLSDGHYRITFGSDGVIRPYRDGTAETTASFDSTVQTIMVGFNNSNNASYSLKFKNFILYPI